MGIISASPAIASRSLGMPSIKSIRLWWFIESKTHVQRRFIPRIASNQILSLVKEVA